MLFHDYSNAFEACNITKKEIPAQVLPCKFCKTFKNTCFTEHSRATLSVQFCQISSCLSLNNQWILLVHLRICRTLQACVRYFFQIFIFPPNDRPSQIIKYFFHFIKKTLFVLKISKIL